ncbi:hypothetical protein ABZ656_08020 [Streptomyces sp. NPDC007095]|uniref:hypothetical protein n=1 Tax=Streptomyces sp. NPDC007095 TaxID=3154482 RepID=UPI0033FF490B
MTDPGSAVRDWLRDTTTNDAQQIERANATGRVPVVFVHGLWLLPSSGDRRAAHLRPVPLRLSPTR